MTSAAGPAPIRERDRYGRASLAEQVGDIVRWFPAHRRESLAIAIVAAILLVLNLLTPPVVHLADLTVGECLFIRTPNAQDVGPDARPIGELVDVRRILADAGAEPAACGQSHSHEVTAIVSLPDPAGTPYPGQATLIARLATGCAATIAAYASTLDVMPVVPTQTDWDAGRRTAACLAFSRDGHFLDHRTWSSGSE